MPSSDLKAAILRILKDDELSGYSVYKLLAMKGVEKWPNHVYTTLVEMEKENGWLTSRWVGEGKGGNRKHLYSLTPSGRGEYDDIVKDSLGILIERFFKENLSFEDLSFHMGLVRETFGVPAGWSNEDTFRLVIASPAYHPLVCFPKFYYAVSEAYPNSSIYVVKRPWEEAKPLEGRKNLTFVDGSRDDIPLRDGFADFILLQGFPSSSSVSTTVGECLRVLKGDGCLFLEIPSILAVERRAPHNTIFPEYVLKLFYELCGQDRSVRIEAVNKMLSASFEHVREIEVRGKVIIHAVNKKAKAVQDTRLPRVGSLGSKVAAIATK